MKVYMMTDMEGVAGVVAFGPQSYPEGKYHDLGKRLVTGEVNAAVEGLVARGVDEVLVVDGHGAGAIWFEDLHPQARLLHGRPSAPRPVLDAVAREYDICMMIGQHAMAGIPTGNQNHTQSSATIDSFRLNGRPIGEIAQFALYEGSFGIPLIFLSGDDEACAEAEALVPGITTVAVKTGLGRSSAISLSASEARRRIREGVKQAIARHGEAPVAPLAWDGPYLLEKRFFHTDVADRAADSPGAERVDGQTVRYRAEKIREIIYR